MTSEKQVPDRNLAMELVRVTEGRGAGRVSLDGTWRQERCRRAAVEAMRIVLRPCRWTASS